MHCTENMNISHFFLNLFKGILFLKEVVLNINLLIYRFMIAEPKKKKKERKKIKMKNDNIQLNISL